MAKYEHIPKKFKYNTHICEIRNPNFDGKTVEKCYFICITRICSMPSDTLVHWHIQQADAATAQGSFLYTNSESGNVGVVRERGRTADDRVIKAELHPPHRAGRQATVHPSRLLLIIWATKNLQLLSHPVCTMLLQQCWLLD